jgi:alanine racemase
VDFETKNEVWRRPCWVEIDTSALEQNYRLLAGLCSEADIGLLAIVKANAYGHGLELCAPAAVRAGAKWLGVTSVEEGVAARQLCPEAEILVVSGVFPGQGPAAVRNRLTTVAWEHWQLDELECAARDAGCSERSVPVHLEIDTGMGRQGVRLEHLDSILQRFSLGSLKLDGLMTHLYAADELDGEATAMQLARLTVAGDKVVSAGFAPLWLHVGNSAAVLEGEVTNALLPLCSRWGMRALMRPGLALYGIAPEFEPDEPSRVAGIHAQLKRVLAWKTSIVSVREIAPGDVVGYNGTFIAREPMRLALLAVGYADGLQRSLSNRGCVLVGSQRCPIVGRISMDQTVVDVTGILEVKPADEVVLIGTQGPETIPVEEHASLARTIPWEIFTSIAERVGRQAIPRGHSGKSR